jgi:hypothetical protein
MSDWLCFAVFSPKTTLHVQKRLLQCGPVKYSMELLNLNRNTVAVESAHTVFCNHHTANEGPVRIQYKCLVLIYVFLEMKLRGLVFPKQDCNVLSPSFCCSQIGRLILEIYKSLTDK